LTFHRFEPLAPDVEVWQAAPIAVDEYQPFKRCFAWLVTGIWCERVERLKADRGL
jgi:hypothetical protein